MIVSRLPDASPAPTMLTKSDGNTPGFVAIASEKLRPFCTSSYIEKHLLLFFIFSLRLQYLKRLYKTYARCKHRRKLTAEERQILRLKLIFYIRRLVLCRILIGCTEQAFCRSLSISSTESSAISVPFTFLPFTSVAT